jgi:hypothetical protein
VCFVSQYSAHREYQIRFERAICMGIEGKIIFAWIRNLCIVYGPQGFNSISIANLISWQLWILYWHFKLEVENYHFRPNLPKYNGPQKYVYLSIFVSLILKDIFFLKGHF